MMHKSTKIPVTAILVAITMSTRLLAVETWTIRGETMGTSYCLRIAEPLTKLDQDSIRQSVAERLETINDLMSTWRGESEISRFNRYSGSDWFSVSNETAMVVEASLDVSRQTEGAFDVTIAPVLKLWKFGPQRKLKSPLPEQIADAHRHVGFQQLQVRHNPPALRKAQAGVELDLSGIAKGFAVDDLGALLESREITNCLVEIGGEIRVRGRKPDGTLWTLGVETPSISRGQILHKLRLTDCSVATSGDHRNVREVGGRIVSHIIDPKTGLAHERDACSVTVIHDQCMIADALATALLVLGPQPALEWAREHHVAALIVRNQGGTLAEESTPEFQSRILPVR